MYTEYNVPREQQIDYLPEDGWKVLRDAPDDPSPFRVSEMSNNALVRKRKDDLRKRMKSFNSHQTTKPGFGQSVRGQNVFTANLQRTKDLKRMSPSMLTMVEHIGMYALPKPSNEAEPLEATVKSVMDDLERGRQQIRQQMKDINMTDDSLKRRDRYRQDPNYGKNITGLALHPVNKI